jgi:riboflavin kinase/FMN adenylyltransferase
MEIENFSSTIKNSEIKELAIGRFDGMHLAHQKLFSKLNKNSGAILAIDPGYSNLTPHSHKQKYTNIPIIFLKLEKIKHIDGLEFIKSLSKEFENLEKIVVGYDFRFGKDRKYDIFDLNSAFDGIVEVVEEVKVDSIGVHSKVIREYISLGNFEVANALLGREYIVTGKQIKGQGIGKEKFVATINLNTGDFLLPSEGIYATKSIVDNKRYDSVTFVGHRVTTDNSYAVETHILDKNIDVIDKENIDVVFITKVRDNKKFETYEELKKQIEIDLIDTKYILEVYNLKNGIIS